MNAAAAAQMALAPLRDDIVGAIHNLNASLDRFAEVGTGLRDVNEKVLTVLEQASPLKREPAPKWRSTPPTREPTGGESQSPRTWASDSRRATPPTLQPSSVASFPANVWKPVAEVSNLLARRFRRASEPEIGEAPEKPDLEESEYLEVYGEERPTDGSKLRETFPMTIGTAHGAPALPRRLLDSASETGVADTRLAPVPPSCTVPRSGACGTQLDP